jgi:alpha/beta superfamily hydrolase
MSDGSGPTPEPVRSSPLELDGPAGVLEAIVDEPAGAGMAGSVDAVAVVCHPHPQHQGTMHNKVVHTLARSLARHGAHTVRFNYRGVGGSAGSYGGGDGETDDALAVIDWLCARHPGAVLYLAGFSFGGMVAIRAAHRRDAAALITVAPAIRFFDDAFIRPACPWLVIQGEADEIVLAADVVRWACRLDPTPEIETMSGVGHFFHGALGTIGDAAATFLDDPGGPRIGAAARGAGAC